MTEARTTSKAALHDLMTGEGSSETYRATAALTHALHDIADAIRAMAPKPVQFKPGGLIIPPDLATAEAVAEMASRMPTGRTYVRHDVAQAAPGRELAFMARTEKAEAERDEAAKLSHRYRNERDAILNELCDLRAPWPGGNRGFLGLCDIIDRHTPESDQ